LLLNTIIPVGGSESRFWRLLAAIVAVRLDGPYRAVRSAVGSASVRLMPFAGTRV
jgi:hypothetical protein